MVSRPNRYAVQPCGFWEAADQVRILHRLTGRSLAEVVDHAHRDHQVTLWIGRITDEREVRASSPFGLRRLVGHADERAPGVEAPGRVQALTRGGAAAAVNGGEYAAGHRHQVWREHHPGRASATQPLYRLGNLGHVDVLERTIGQQVLVTLGVAEFAVGAAPAGTRDAGLDVDHDVTRLDQLVSQQWRQRVQRRRGEATGIGDADLTLDLGWPDVGQAVHPTLDVAVVAADVDNLHVLGDARQRLGRRPRGQRREQHVEIRQGHRVPLLDHQLGQLGRHTGEAVHQPAAGAALARGVDELERGVARDQAHRLAAAKTADPDNAHANAHGGVLVGFGQKKTPGAEGLRGFRNAGRAAPAGGTYGEAVTTRTDADRRAAQRAAAWVQRRRRRSQRFWFLSMSFDTVVTHINRQAECLLTTYLGRFWFSTFRDTVRRPAAGSGR